MTDNYKTSEVGPGSLKAFGNGLFTLAFTVAINELLCLKNDINVFHIKCTLGGIASICFRFHFQETLRMHPQGCQGCHKIRNFVRNSKMLIARSTIQPKLNKIKIHLPFFDEF